MKDSATGATLKFDEQYVQESIENPQKVMRPEYVKAAQMPSYKGRFKAKELAAITAFMKALEDGQVTPEEESAMPPPEAPAATGDGASQDQLVRLKRRQLSHSGDANTHRFRYKVKR